MQRRFELQYSKPGQAVQSHIDLCRGTVGTTEQMSVFETFGFVNTIPDHLTCGIQDLCA